MLNYTIKRLVLSALTIFIVATLTFFLMFLVPGGPFLSEKAPSKATLEAMNAKYGLDKPVMVQYKNYLMTTLKGDFGVSLKRKGMSINRIIAEKFPVSAKIGGIAVCIALVVGVTIGSVAALNHGKWIDNVLVIFGTLGIAIPGFVSATVFLIFFGVTLGALPTRGLASGLHYIMPCTTLALYPTAFISRLTRSSMLDVLSQDYIKTARAKGVSLFFILFKHALRNAIIPVVTYLGPLLAYILTGNLIIERVFSIPGLGSEFVSSISNRDYPVIMATTIFLAALVVFMNFVVDILYKLVDPRIQLR